MVEKTPAPSTGNCQMPAAARKATSCVRGWITIGASTIALYGQKLITHHNAGTNRTSSRVCASRARDCLAIPTSCLSVARFPLPKHLLQQRISNIGPHNACQGRLFLLTPGAILSQCDYRTLTSPQEFTTYDERRSFPFY